MLWELRLRREETYNHLILSPSILPHFILFIPSYFILFFTLFYLVSSHFTFSHLIHHHNIFILFLKALFDILVSLTGNNTQRYFKNQTHKASCKSLISFLSMSLNILIWIQVKMWIFKDVLIYFSCWRVTARRNQ